MVLLALAGGFERSQRRTLMAYGDRFLLLRLNRAELDRSRGGEEQRLMMYALDIPRLREGAPAIRRLSPLNTAYRARITGRSGAGERVRISGVLPEIRRLRTMPLADEGKFMSLEELVRGARHMPASNHWGMQVGGGALAVLAIMKDPGVDAERIEKLLEESEKAMLRNMTEGFGDHGWFAEGDGTGIMASFISYLPALQAWKIAGGKDFIAPRPNAPWMVLRWLMGTIVRDGKPDFPSRGAYPHNVWSMTGVSGPGVFSEGFGILPRDEEKRALLWLYRRLDYAGEAPYETQSEYPHRAVLSFVNWPFRLEEKDPGEVLPAAVIDSMSGLFMARNRWKDENDILITHQALSTRGWHKANTDGRVWIWGLGRRTKFPLRFSGKPVHFEAHPRGGSYTLDTDVSFGVDFSDASGADAVLVLAGKMRGEVSESDSVRVFEQDDTRVVVMTLQKGKPPEATSAPSAEGATVTIGELRVVYDGEKVSFGR